MTEHATSPLAITETARSSGMDVGAVVLLVVMNVAIVAYAIHVTRPHEDAPAAVTADEPVIARVAAETVTQVDLPAPEHVQATYLQHCAACHGLDGRGSGPAAEQLYPKPRDFID